MSKKDKKEDVEKTPKKRKIRNVPKTYENRKTKLTEQQWNKLEGAVAMHDYSIADICRVVLAVCGSNICEKTLRNQIKQRYGLTFKEWKQQQFVSVDVMLRSQLIKQAFKDNKVLLELAKRRLPEMKQDYIGGETTVIAGIPDATELIKFTTQANSAPNKITDYQDAEIIEDDD